MGSSTIYRSTLNIRFIDVARGLVHTCIKPSFCAKKLGRAGNRDKPTWYW